jgi:GrxC family glutaredoxin
MPKVTVYTTDYCPFCDAAKSFLKAKGIPFEEIDVSSHEKKIALKKRTGWMTVPQIFIGDHLIGGYQELVALDQMGELQKRLKAS